MNLSQPAMLFDLFMAFNRRMTLIIQKLNPLLARSESHILGEIHQQRIINSSILIQNLGLEKTKVSRIISNFTAKKWIEVQQSNADKRIRYLTITTEGNRIFQDDNKLRNRQIAECLQRLSAAERKDLSVYCSQIADSLGASFVPAMADDASCKVEYIRLARAFGFLGDNLLGLNLPVDECQILQVVHREGDTVSMSTLKSLLPYEATMLSRHISSLCDRGLLSKRTLDFDKRHIQVLLTPKGLDQTIKNLAVGGQKIFDALQKTSPNKSKQLIALLEKALIQESTHVQDSLKSSGTVIEIINEESRTNARAFLIQTLVNQKRAHEIRESILHPDNICFQLLVFGEIRGVCEISITKNRANIIYFVTSLDTTDSKQSSLLYLNTIENALATSKSSKLTVNNTDFLPNSLQELFGYPNKSEASKRIIKTLKTRLNS
jgi:DNA-binding MarR family transcriptional regulator